jgi:acyl-coenzyme A thioesterase PaaI-like protein
MDGIAFQDLMVDNHCFGCGPTNADGLRIKSYWHAQGEAICTYQPQSHQMAGPRHILNGGIIATLIDCHSVCTAVAQAYRDEGREIGSAPGIWYATGTMTIKYLRPTPIAAPVVLLARIVEANAKKTVVHCMLTSNDEPCATGDVVAVRVPWSWREDE